MTDTKALKIIKEEGIPIKRGCVLTPLGYQETPEVREAINYLCGEWDYACLTPQEYEEEVK